MHSSPLLSSPSPPSIALIFSQANHFINMKAKLPFLHSLPAIFYLSYFFIFLITTQSLATTTTSNKPNNYKNFIKTSCQHTRYRDLCFQTLYPYASTIQTSPTELANAALNVSLANAESISNMVLELSKGSDLSHREAEAIRDCLEDMGDSVDELQKSMVAMKELDGPDFEEKMGNVMTWVSAAMTDEDTCLDGFDEHGGTKLKMKSKIRGNIVKLAELTSNALALINHIYST